MTHFARLAFLSLSFFSLPLLDELSSAPELVLVGKITGAQNNTYIEIPFEVPAGVHRVSVDFSYTGKDHKIALNLGVTGPERFRDNSWGNKSQFTLNKTDAPLSCLPGAIPKGRWKPLVSVPNIRHSEESS
jgi:hypothetical protein